MPPPTPLLAGSQRSKKVAFTNLQEAYVRPARAHARDQPPLAPLLDDVVDEAAVRARERAQPAERHEARYAQPPQPRALQHGAPAAPRVLHRLAHPHLDEPARVALALDRDDIERKRTGARTHISVFLKLGRSRRRRVVVSHYKRRTTNDE